MTQLSNDICTLPAPALGPLKVLLVHRPESYVQRFLRELNVDALAKLRVEWEGLSMGPEYAAALAHLIESRGSAALAEPIAPELLEHVHRLLVDWHEVITAQARAKLRSLETDDAADLLARGAVSPDLELMLDEVLGRNPTSVLYRASSSAWLGPLAVRVHLVQVVDRARVERQVARLHGLRHPGIAPVYASAIHQGCVCVIRAFVRGHSLATRNGREPFRDPLRAARLMLEIARIVQYAHEQGIQHRRLAPGNVVIDAMGEPVLCDFYVGGLGTNTELQTASTRAFAAPELSEVDAELGASSADVYALGGILAFLIGVRDPELAPYSQTSMPRSGAQPTRSRESHLLWRGLERICRMALSSKPRDRYVSVRHLVEDLEGALLGQTIQAQPARGKSLQRFTAALGAIALLTVLALGQAATSVLLQSSGVTIPGRPHAASPSESTCEQGPSARAWLSQPHSQASVLSRMPIEHALTRDSEPCRDRWPMSDIDASYGTRAARRPRGLHDDASQLESSVLGVGASNRYSFGVVKAFMLKKPGVLGSNTVSWHRSDSARDTFWTSSEEASR